MLRCGFTGTTLFDATGTSDGTSRATLLFVAVVSAAGSDGVSTELSVMTLLIGSALGVAG